MYITMASTPAELLSIHLISTRMMPAKRMAALTTPIKAPPAMKPDASRVPFSRRTLFRAWSLLRFPTYQLLAPPISNGVFNSSGMNMPNANAIAGILQKFRMMASTAPMAYSAQGAPEPLINGSITAAIALACGAASCPLVKPYV